MARTAIRGSTKLWADLFEKEPPTDEELSRAIAAAGESFRVLRWWKYGQPAVDRVTATIDVGLDDAGGTIAGILGVHGRGVQVTVHAFPHGIPTPDGVRIDLVMDRAVRAR